MTMTDKAILEEMGRRIERVRIDSDLTQAALAKEAGLSKRTVERIESGEDAQFTSIIRILRVLKLLDSLNQLVPEIRVRPMDALKLKGKSRKRVRTTASAKDEKWEWGENQ
ncbi:MAG: helix-turn-helix domain-containing protein [Rhodothermales bacterium]|nr:helix-turn-helix domain-containing protein [Rhodothermales bacterium]